MVSNTAYDSSILHFFSILLLNPNDGKVELEWLKSKLDSMGYELLPELEAFYTKNADLQTTLNDSDSHEFFSKISSNVPGVDYMSGVNENKFCEMDTTLKNAMTIFDKMLFSRPKNPIEKKTQVFSSESVPTKRWDNLLEFFARPGFEMTWNVQNGPKSEIDTLGKSTDVHLVFEINGKTNFLWKINSGHSYLELPTVQERAWRKDLLAHLKVQILGKNFEKTPHSNDLQALSTVYRKAQGFNGNGLEYSGLGTYLFQLNEAQFPHFYWSIPTQREYVKSWMIEVIMLGLDRNKEFVKGERPELGSAQGLINYFSNNKPAFFALFTALPYAKQVELAKKIMLKDPDVQLFFKEVLDHVVNSLETPERRAIFIEQSMSYPISIPYLQLVVDKTPGEELQSYLSKFVAVRNSTLFKKVLEKLPPGAIEKYEDNNGLNLLMVAFQESFTDAVMAIFEKVTPDYITQPTRTGKTVLSFALSQYSTVPLSALMLNMPAFDWQQRDQDGNSIVAQAATKGRQETLQWILSHFPEQLQTTNKDGHTPLEATLNSALTAFFSPTASVGYDYTAYNPRIQLLLEKTPVEDWTKPIGVKQAFKSQLSRPWTPLHWIVAFDTNDGVKKKLQQVDSSVFESQHVDVFSLLQAFVLGQRELGLRPLLDFIPVEQLRKILETKEIDKNPLVLFANGHTQTTELAYFEYFQHILKLALELDPAYIKNHPEVIEKIENTGGPLFRNFIKSFTTASK